MGHAIDISQLKSGGSSTTKPKEPNPNNSGKNIDGQKLREFEGGLKEFDPAANGFEPVKIERKPNDKDRALQAFDKQMAERREEVERYNELLDQYGGQISEEELRAEFGQDHITRTLHDGVGGEYEDKPGQNVDASAIIKDDQQSTAEQEGQTSQELDELERELEMEDVMETPSYQQQTEEQSGFVDPNLARLRARQAEEQAIQNIPKPQDTYTEETTTISETEVDAISEDTSVPVQSKAIHKEAKAVNAQESVSSGAKPIEVATAPKQTDISEEDKDLKALDDDADVAPTEDFDEKLKAELAKKMRPVSKKFDLANAVVSQTPVTVTNALADIVPLDKKVFTWGLYRSKRPVTLKAFTATELNSLSSYMDSAARSRDVFKAIWDHIVRGQGKDFDTWLKTTSYYDVDHLWFAVYGACFGETNYLPYTCPECSEITVSADIDLGRMCKFASDQIKEEFNQILHSPSEQSMGSVFAEYRVQVSDSFVVGLREPSIYDAVIVPNMLDTEFRNKYRDIIGLNAYISNIYKAVDTGAQVKLCPIAVKQFIGNETKSVKARIIQYAKIIRSLTSDQYNIIMGHVNTLNETDTIYYRLPSVTCDHCKKEIPEEREAAADLVFMRHRLGILGI